MALNIEDIRGLEFNPSAVVHKALTVLGEQGVEISNANNAFTFLLEYASNLSLSTTQAFKSEMKKAFPALATNIEELYPHLNAEEVKHLFAKPGSITLQGVVYIMSMKQHGLHINNYRETVIPKLTTFKYNNLTFTLTNDLTVRVHDRSEMVEVISKPNDTLISNNVDIFLDTLTGTDALGNPYVQFPLQCKQVELFTQEAPIYSYETTIIEHTLTDKFYGAIAHITTKDGKKTTVNIKFTEDFLNPAELTVFAKIINNKVTFKLPSTYAKLQDLTGSLEIIVYETKGASFLPLYNVKPSEIKYEYGDMSHLTNRTISRGVEFLPKAERDTYFDGGADPLTFEQIKTKLITNSFTRNMPVTEYDIYSLGMYSDLKLSKVEDNLTSRVYIANRGLEEINAQVVKAIPDVYNNTAKIDTVSFQEQHPDKISASRKYIFLPSGTLFKEDNGSVRPLTRDEMQFINDLSVNEKIDFFKTNKHFFNPFYYSISTAYNQTTAEIFSFDLPKVLSYLVREVNNGILGGMTISVKRYGIERTKNGYRLYFDLAGDQNFKAMDLKYVNLQLTMKNKDGAEIFIKGNLDNTNTKEPYWYIDLDTTLMVEDGHIKITNGESTVAERLVKFDNEMDLHIYLNDPNRMDPSRFLVNEINEKSSNIVVCLKSKLRVKFGEKLEFLWNRVYAVQGKRSYVLAEKDIPLTYKENVYQRDVNGIIIYTKDPLGNNIIPKIAHKKGDVVIDANGKTVIDIHKGQPILNSFGEPIIDKIEETPIKNIEMLMLEYEYKIGDDYTSKRILESAIDKIYAMITTTLKEMNSKLLEKTRIYYKGNKRTLPILANVNGAERTLSFAISPIVTLYIQKDAVIGSDIIEGYRKIIGLVLTSYLQSDDTIIFKKVIEELMVKLNNSSISGISIKGFYKPAREDEVEEDMITLRFTDDERRPVIGKVLEYNVSKNFEVKYDVSISVVRI